MSRDRRAARQRGRFAESLCALALRLKGWRILARGFTVGRGSGAGEVDIIARRGRVVAFVEVKARADLATAAEALMIRQRRRIARAAEAFLQRNPALSDCATRFDVMLVAPFAWPRHLPDAWRADG